MTPQALVLGAITELAPPTGQPVTRASREAPTTVDSPNAARELTGECVLDAQTSAVWSSDVSLAPPWSRQELVAWWHDGPRGEVMSNTSLRVFELTRWDGDLISADRFAPS